MKQRRAPKRVYLDFAAATPLAPRALKAYVKALALYGNPSAPHAEGRAAKDALSEARTLIARSFDSKPDEIVCTSGGTESNSIAILGTVRAAHKAGVAYADIHCVTSTIEHSSVKEDFAILESLGVSVTYVAPHTDGTVHVEDVLKALTPDTLLVSLAHVNSELGTIQPVADIGATLKKLDHKIFLHVDASQSPLWLDASPNTLRADLVTYDAQKVMGPKGVGVLYRDYAVPLMRVVGGGTQERGIRAGTENVPAIVAAGVAFSEAAKGRKVRAAKVAKLRDSLAQEIVKRIPDARVLGSMKRRVSNNLFIALPHVDGDYLAVLMDTAGVAVTPRSACLGSGGALSEVAFSVTGDKALARGTIRFTLGPLTTKADITQAVAALAQSVPLAQSEHSHI